MSLTTKQIADQTGVRESIVIFIFALTYAQRSALRALLTQAEGFILAQAGGLVGLTTYMDVMGDMIGSIRIAMEQALIPVDKLMSTIPFDEMVKVDPDGQKLVDAIVENINITIPSTEFLNFIGLGGFDLFEGVNNYQDLKRKIRELGYRAQRAVTVSQYANITKSNLDQDLRVVRQYIEVIDAI